MKNKTLKRIGKLVGSYKKTIAIVTILALFISAAELIKPYLVKVIIDEYLSKGIMQKGAITIGMIGAIYIAIVIIGNILDFLVQTTTSFMGEDVVYHLRNKLYRYIEHANVSFHDKTPTGTIFVRITNDIEDIATLFKDVITTSLKDVVLIVAIISMMLCFHVKLSLLTFAIFPLVMLVSAILTKIINTCYTYSKNIRTKINIFLSESIYGMKLIKIFNIREEKQKEFEELNQKFYQSRKLPSVIEGVLPGAMVLLENLAVSLIVWAGVNHWFGIHIDPGLLYIFITYIKNIFDPIARIIENIETLQESIVSINKVYDILEKTEYIEDLEAGKMLDQIKGKIEFKHVWFAYEKEDWILRDISFTIHPGESIALVGKTGSGKTTITNLINRFYEIQKGEILIDGVNIKELNIHDLRRRIGTILQDPFIYARSIKENITLNEEMEDEDVWAAIELASANEFVNSLPKGMETIANERGSSYSTGQKQLLAFARIFAHNPSIFILDEATANIDTHTEQLIQKSVDIISKKKTSIFIAHRLSTIVNVDKILVLDHGRIMEEGNHQELLQKENGYYSKLYQSYYASLTAS